jgi:threonylcarbamoyladenosine tRNA methylthiotransferase MtaB
MSSDPQIITFGCRLNTYESEVIRNHARAAGLSDTIIFNTCAVTGEAERQARQAIRKARRENPAARIMVTGCGVEIARAKFEAMPEITAIVPNAAKMKAASWIDLPLPAGEAGSLSPAGLREPGEGLQQTSPSPDTLTPYDISVSTSPAGRGDHHLVTGFDGLARAFVQVQNGCDHRCTFCIIPFARGASRSVPIDEIVSQTRLLVERGYREIVLTGVDITSFGSDLPGQPKLGQMVKRLLALVPDLSRLRLSSLDPAEIDADLWDMIADEPRLMPHLHLSMQSGDDLVLKRMKRRHSRAQALDVCRRAKQIRPDIAIGADFIAGFPTESDAMAQRTIDFVGQCDLTFLHVFPYSNRPGTPAAKMPAVNGEIVKQRAADLRVVGQAQLNRFLQNRLGRDESVLVEAIGVGRTEHFAETKLDPSHIVGSVVPFRATAIDGNKLVQHV